jgi:hypothetical protein
VRALAAFAAHIGASKQEEIESLKTQVRNQKSMLLRERSRRLAAENRDTQREQELEMPSSTYDGRITPVPFAEAAAESSVSPALFLSPNALEASDTFASIKYNPLHSPDRDRAYPLAMKPEPPLLHPVPEPAPSSPVPSSTMRPVRFAQSLHLAHLLGDDFIFTPSFEDATETTNPDAADANLDTDYSPAVAAEDEVPTVVVAQKQKRQRVAPARPMAQILQSFSLHPWTSETLISDDRKITLVVWGGNSKAAKSPPVPMAEQHFLPYAPVFQYEVDSRDMYLVGMIHPRDRVPNADEIASDVPLPRRVDSSLWCVWKSHPFVLEKDPSGNNRLIDRVWSTTNMFCNFIETATLAPIIHKYWNFTSSRSAPRETEIILPGNALYPEFDVETFDGAKQVTYSVEVPLEKLSDEKYAPSFFSVKACETLLQKIAAPTFLSDYGRLRTKVTRARLESILADANQDLENTAGNEPPRKKTKVSESDD